MMLGCDSNNVRLQLVEEKPTRLHFCVVDVVKSCVGNRFDQVLVKPAAKTHHLSHPGKFKVSVCGINTLVLMTMLLNAYLMVLE
jgi:hypothetical protein